MLCLLTTKSCSIACHDWRHESQIGKTTNVYTFLKELHTYNLQLPCRRLLLTSVNHFSRTFKVLHNLFLICSKNYPVRWVATISVLPQVKQRECCTRRCHYLTVFSCCIVPTHRTPSTSNQLRINVTLGKQIQSNWLFHHCLKVRI